jgi:hypothetical protein
MSDLSVIFFTFLGENCVYKLLNQIKLQSPMEKQPKCELTPNEHSMYIRFL